MSAVDLSSDAGLVAMVLLTVNILLGLLISVRYNPRRNWPHRRISIFQIHNWTAYIALACVLLHPILLLASSSAGFRITDILFPIKSPQQTLYNNLGALAFYSLLLVVGTSYFRRKMAHSLWKKLHYVAYAVAALVFTHGLLIDPNLKQMPPDLLDGEKVLIEGCALAVLAGTAWRVRYGMTRNIARKPIPPEGAAG